MKYLKGILLPALVALAPLAAAKADKPLVESTDFDGGELVNLFYFDDSNVALFAEVETGKIHRSTDAGKTWEEQKKLQTEVGIIKNPFDNKVAVVLGDTKHWITYDQGEKWHQFETEVSPSIAGSGLSFHARDNKKILFHGAEDCILTPCLGDVSQNLHIDVSPG